MDSRGIEISHLLPLQTHIVETFRRLARVQGGIRGLAVAEIREDNAKKVPYVCQLPKKDHLIDRQEEDAQTYGVYQFRQPFPEHRYGRCHRFY